MHGGMGFGEYNYALKYRLTSIFFTIPNNLVRIASDSFAQNFSRINKYKNLHWHNLKFDL